MGKLFETIKQLVADEKYVVGQHASERLEERGIMEWQAVAALADGELIAEKNKAIGQKGTSWTKRDIVLFTTCCTRKI